MMEINTVNDVKKYILTKYPNVNKNKFEIIKIGWATRIYLVDNNNNLQYETLFRRTLSSTNGLRILKSLLDINIYKALSKHMLIVKDENIERIIADKNSN